MSVREGEFILFNRSNNNSSYGNTNLTTGMHIWKYYGEKSNSNNFFKTRNGIILIMYIIAVIVLGAILIISIKFNRGRGISKILSWAMMIIIIVFTAFLVKGSKNIAIKTNAMKLIFARNIDGRLFVFDYDSEVFKNYLVELYREDKLVNKPSEVKALFITADNIEMKELFKYVDDNKIIDQLINDKSVYIYGKEITKVKAIERNKEYCNVYCSVENRMEQGKEICLTIPASYLNYNELINALKSLQETKSYDIEIFAKGEKKLKLAMILTLILTIISLIGCVGTRIYLENNNIQATNVSAIVVSRETSTFTIDKYKVIVRYNGNDYRLNNVHDLWPYIPGKSVKVYLTDNGKLYADLAGVKTSSSYGTAYFIFLAATLVFLIAFAIYKQKLKKYRIHISTTK